MQKNSFRTKICLSDPDLTPAREKQKNTHRNSQRLQTVQSVEAVVAHGNDPIVVEMPAERARETDGLMRRTENVDVSF